MGKSSAPYALAHYRVQRLRGRAAEHSCASCGKPAYEWAYDHRDPNEQRDQHGREFSSDPAHYLPMCRSCHRYFDADHRGKSKCGTYGGYFRHRRRGEQTCAACRAACAAAQRRRAQRRKSETPVEEA